ncbi:NAD-dependent epimerase/dehydratase family protein [Tieghemostelium lacteum]|uniref:NAD-dependent epimerase/dehydratase family protein n=1 Tax=Tieghemostelium lacteum TaxID=361077 RepID=A0A152A394_TIELA|nr:NAD-dependent epimerase/dehydratase family protein [Tieghemostelium lacteum]|eukprot:KYR00696.1 NAD-dependent epimerase/dehydratase family protein [Tieghemostelium lacteum]
MQTKQQIKKILIGGSSGFIGTALIRHLQEQGMYDIYQLVRRPVTGGYEIEWDPERSSIDTHAIETIQPEVIIHLGGENIMGFWTEQKKKKILDSRVKSTKLLSDTIATLKHKPQLFICASGCTYYGSDVYLPVDEYSPKGTGFFSNVVEKWEKACDTARYENNLPGSLVNSASHQDLHSSVDSNISISTGPMDQLNFSTDSLESSSNHLYNINNTNTNTNESSMTPSSKVRIVNLRIGLVFDRSGAFLSTVYYPFKFGLGGVMGSGNQWIPWISLRDTCRSIQYIIENDDLNGPVNITGPNPTTNSTFTRMMGYVLNRPTIFWVPEFLIKLVLGSEMAKETILSSQRVIPTK